MEFTLSLTLLRQLHTLECKAKKEQALLFLLIAWPTHWSNTLTTLSELPWFTLSTVKSSRLQLISKLELHEHSEAVAFYILYYWILIKSTVNFYTLPL